LVCYCIPLLNREIKMSESLACPVSIGARVFAGVPYKAIGEMVVRLDSGQIREVPNNEEFMVWEDGRTDWPQGNPTEADSD
jgi:hypothetical protein